MKIATLILASGSLLLSGTTAFAQDVVAGQGIFEARCAGCHGGGGTGGELGPRITDRVQRHDDEGLATVVQEGFPNSGMPGFQLNDADRANLIAYLRTFVPPDAERERKTVETLNGETLEGEVMNESNWGVQLLNDYGRLTLLRKDGDLYRRVTSEKDWGTYHGGIDGNRFTSMTQITKENVHRMAPKWTFTMGGVGQSQTTPIVVDGVMYVTSANECWALDAGSGAQIWRHTQPRTEALIGNAAGGINRGVAISGDRLFMVTDHAHLLALNRFTGEVLWDQTMADWRQNYNATSAPLIVGDLVVTGTAGGDEGVRGFIAAFDQRTGNEAWRTWTVPLEGEPGSETWQGGGIAHPSAAAWFTGNYDPELGLVYWQTGNPGPDLNGDYRLGDNLYSDSMLALDAKTGELKWYFQYTPHDVWDWDAEQPFVLVDKVWKGQERKLLLHAARNGFFYVLDRTTGEYLLGKQFVENLTWATGLDDKGRPIRIAGMEPSEEGQETCPSLLGATNWYSTAYNAATGLYYLQTLEACDVFTKRHNDWEAGKGYFGGSRQYAPGKKPQKVLRAIDIETGEIRWELPQTGPGTSWGGVLGTASGLVIYADDSGALAAADARTGEPLWHFPMNNLWKASPMTYMFDGKQYVAIASGSNIVSFALVD